MKSPDDGERSKRGRVRVSRDLSSVAHPTRLAIMRALEDGPRTTNELETELEESRYNLYHHLSVLKDDGYIEEAKKGRTKVFSLREKVESGKELQKNLQEISRLTQSMMIDEELLNNLQGASGAPAQAPDFEVDLQEAPAAEQRSILGSLNKMLSKKGKKKLSSKKKYRLRIEEYDD